MMHVELGVVVERRRSRCRAAGQIEIVGTGILPPWLEGLGVEIGAVSVVVQPQTEARSGQSIRPDLGVLSMAADGGGQPLLTQMLRDLGVGPGEGIFTVTNELEGLVPAVGGVDH